MIIIKASKTHSLGMQVILKFQLTQHSRDEQLMKSLIKFFDCGNIYKDRNAFNFQVRKFGDITQKRGGGIGNWLFILRGLRPPI